MRTPVPNVARSLWRARTFAIATGTTVALAIGAGCAVFTLINAVLLRPLPYPDSDRLVGLWHSFPGIGVPLLPQSTGTYSTYRQSAKSFEDIGAYVGGAATLTDADPRLQPERISVGHTTASVFSVLRARPVIGRLLIDADQRPGAEHVAVIDERLWRDRFHGDSATIGRTIQVDGVACTIVGVISTAFGSPETQLWVPLNVESTGDTLGTFAYQAIGRLRPGVSLATAQDELQHLLIRTPERYPELRRGVPTASLLERGHAVALVHSMRDDVIGGSSRVLALIAATVALLIIVALSNVTSLLLVRLDARQRELAVRLTLGASASRIRRALYAEAAMVVCAGGVAGVGLAIAALSLLVRAAPRDVPRLNELRFDWAFVGSAVLLTALFGAVSAAIAAARVRPSDTAHLLRGGTRSMTAGLTTSRTRSAFVVVQIALSVVLLSGSLVLGRSLLRLRAVKTGFAPANTLTFRTSLPANTTAMDVARFYRGAVDAIDRIPGVVSAGVVSRLPLERAGEGTSLLWVDRGPAVADALPVPYNVGSASSGYFGAIGIPVVAGRVFDVANIERGLNEVVVSRGFVEHYWNDSTGQAGLGQRLRQRADAPWYTIVGVVDDICDTSLTAPASAEVYFPEEAGPDTAVRGRTFSAMAFVVRTRGPVATLTNSVSAAIHGLDPTLPLYQLSTMDAIVADALAHTSFALLLLAIGASATLALGVVGLYGVIAYVVSLRSREIGIRIALGLTPAKAARMIVVEGEAIAAVGSVAGLVLFVAFAKLLSGFAFGVSAVDTTSLMIATAAVFALAGLATWMPARRAARIDPTETLKSD